MKQTRLVAARISIRFDTYPRVVCLAAACEVALLLYASCDGRWQRNGLGDTANARLHCHFIA